MIADEKTYLQYEKMLHKIAWSYHRTTGLEVDDLKSEANVAFLQACETYDAKKAKVSTWIWKCVVQHLNAYIKPKGVQFCYFDENIPDPRNIAEEREDFQAVIESMSKEAQQIVQIVLEAPAEFFTLSSRFARGILFRKLRKMGWTWESIWTSFREIKNVLNNGGQ